MICISALCIFWKWQFILILIKHSVTYSKFIFRRGSPNKMFPTKTFELILNDQYGGGRCCNTFQTRQTFHIKTHMWVHCDWYRWQWKKVTMTTFLFQCCVFCISFIVLCMQISASYGRSRLLYCVCRSQRPMAGVRLLHRPNLRGLELCC